MKSILTENMNRCMLIDGSCFGRIEYHHVMPASNRKKSTEYGLIAPLCSNHHRISREAVHNNAENMNFLKAKAHIAFEKYYPGLSWLKIFGRNYRWIIDEESE